MCILLFFPFAVLGIEPRTLCILDKYSALNYISSALCTHYFWMKTKNCCLLYEYCVCWFETFSLLIMLTIISCITHILTLSYYETDLTILGYLLSTGTIGVHPNTPLQIHISILDKTEIEPCSLFKSFRWNISVYIELICFLKKTSSKLWENQIVTQKVGHVIAKYHQNHCIIGR